jgi:hypothetical protein
MILSLPIDDTPVCGMVAPTEWKDSIRHVIGLPLPDVAPDQKDRKTTGMPFEWLTAHFNNYPEGAEDAVVQSYVWSCV